jgi:ketosteroid isomerase-like protein
MKQGAGLKPASTKLSPAIANYFAAKNRQDIETMLSVFADGAVVRDESRTHTGRTEIRAWMEETTRKYRATAEVSEVASDGDRVRVGAIVSGTFPGSPVKLRFTFTLREGRIGGLEIGS